MVVITQRRSFSSWWKKACEKEAHLESISCIWMWVVSEQSTRRVNSIHTRKDPDCHQMKFEHYPISNRETEVKRGSAVISFCMQKYFSDHRRLAPMPFHALAAAVSSPVLDCACFSLTADQHQWSSDSLTGQVLSFLRVFEGTVSSLCLKCFSSPIQ